MNTWHRYIPDAQPPIYWFKTPAAVMELLRPLGFHCGYWREAGVDANILQAAGCGSDPQKKIPHLQKWISFVDREAALLSPGYATLWFPQATPHDEVACRMAFGERLVEIEAATLEEVLHKFRLTRWNFGVFYHVACMGNWKAVVEEQLGLLRSIGLSGVYVSFLGRDQDWEYFAGRARHHAIRISLQYSHDSLSIYELPAIRLIQDWAQANKGGYVLYFHTKGVSRPDDGYAVLWRRLMQACVLREWHANAERLRLGTEVVGHFWQVYPNINHVPGNFWMARASFINTLEDFNAYFCRPRHGILRNRPRFSAEFWLGSGRRDPVLYSHIADGAGIDRPAYWSKKYPQISGYLALCLWCKDEGAYLPEWLDYHLGLGVDHVFIFDNNSSDPLEDHLLPYFAAGKVTLLRDQDESIGRQCRGYARCLKQFGAQYQWMGFIDTDEFVVPKTGQTLPELLSRYEAFGGLGIFWYCYGSNGLKSRPSSVVRSFTKRSEDDFDSNDHVKCFVQPVHVSDEVPGTTHYFHFKEGYYCVDENGQPIEGSRRRPRTSEKVQLNHYILRSEEEWREKARRGTGNGGSRHDADFFAWHDERCNRVEDPRAVQVLEGLRT